MNCVICDCVFNKLLPLNLYYCSGCYQIVNTLPYIKIKEELLYKEELYEYCKINAESKVLCINCEIPKDTLVGKVTNISEDELWGLKSREFDVIIGYNVIQNAIGYYIKDIDIIGENSILDFIKKCKELLNDKGVVVLTVHNAKFITNVKESIDFTRVTDIRNNYFNSSSMKLLCKRANMELNNVEYVTEGTGKPIDVNYLFEISNYYNVDNSNVSEYILEEMDDEIYSEKTYTNFFLYYIKEVCVKITNCVNLLIK